jgi:RNA polymerase sigma-70 factor (ECF subfamily)
VRDRAAAEDVVVEAFWRAHRSRARFDPSRSFGAWMRRIATRVAIDQLNATRRRRWVSLDDLSNRVGRVPLGEGHVTRSGPAAADEIRRAFRALPPKLQVVAVLALIEEEPLAGIAEVLDLPIGTVKSRLFRATRQLRKELARLGVHA